MKSDLTPLQLRLFLAIATLGVVLILWGVPTLLKTRTSDAAVTKESPSTAAMGIEEQLNAWEKESPQIRSIPSHPVLSPAQVAESLRGALVEISTDAGAYGSGFYIDEERILTAAHVLRGARRVWIQPSGSKKRFAVVDRWLVDPVLDLATFRVPKVSKEWLRLGDDTLAVGSRVYLMANPLGQEGTFTEGLVSAVRSLDGIRHIQHSADSAPGSSGGPLVTADGSVIGVLSSAVMDRRRGGDTFKLAVASRYIVPFVLRHGAFRHQAFGGLRYFCDAMADRVVYEDKEENPFELAGIDVDDLERVERRGNLRESRIDVTLIDRFDANLKSGIPTFRAYERSWVNSLHRATVGATIDAAVVVRTQGWASYREDRNDSARIIYDFHPFCTVTLDLTGIIDTKHPRPLNNEMDRDALNLFEQLLPRHSLILAE